MFAIPVSTDAPLEEVPWGTIGVIAANVIATGLVFSGVCGAPEDVFANYGLTHGEWHPVQWLTSSLLHNGLIHLFFNMFFLWGFGLVVEGRLGVKRFVPTYLGLAIGEAIIEQGCLRHCPMTCGASSAVFGLMMIALIWAPLNELTCAYFFPLPFHAGMIDVSIWGFSVFLLVKECIFASLSGLLVNSAVLHLAGALLGVGVGITLLKLRVVDCQHWDLFSVMKGNNRSDLLHRSDGEISRVKSTKSDESKKPNKNFGLDLAPQRKIQCLKAIHKCLKNGRPVDACERYEYTRHLMPDWQLPRVELTNLAQALFDAEHWPEALKLFREYIDRWPDDSDAIRLLAAELLIHKQQRPQAGLKLLEPVLATHQQNPLRSQAMALLNDGRRMVDDGVLEADQS